MQMVLLMFLQKIKEQEKNKKFKFKLQEDLAMRKSIRWLKKQSLIKRQTKRKGKLLMRETKLIHYCTQLKKI